jgi:hypothetical protein
MTGEKNIIRDYVNVYDEAIPVERLAAALALTEPELQSLWYAAPRGAVVPPVGKRSAYARSKLFQCKLVKTLWCHDQDNDEVFFTWQRTGPGERLLEWHLENGFKPPVPPDVLIESDPETDAEGGL